MCIWTLDVRKLTVPLWLTLAQLVQQVIPFGGELPDRFAHVDVGVGENELGLIELVSAFARFRVDTGEISIDAPDWIVVRPEACQLRMMTVPAGGSLKHGAREERLTPQRHQPGCIQVSGMDGPETQLAFLA